MAVEVLEYKDGSTGGLLNKTYAETTTPLERKSNKIGTYRQILLTALVTPSMISLAHVLAYPALMVPQLRNKNSTLNLNLDEGSWYISIYSLCSPVGSLLGGIMMDRYGRWKTLATPLIPMILTWIITATATNRTVLFMTRICLGIFGGFIPPICQVYFAECADSDFRGVTINVGYVSLSAGFLITFTLGAMVDWRLLAWSGIIFPMVTLIGVFFLPETPIWLVRNGQSNRAYKSLVWLRGDESIARYELNEHLSRFSQEMEAAQNSSSPNSLRDFLRPSIMKPIVIVFGFILLFNLSGTYLIIYYAIDILSQVNLKIDAKTSNVILSVVRLVVTIGFCWLFMNVKRRKIYLIAGIGSTFSTLVLAGFLFKQDLFSDASSISLWTTATLLLIYVATNTGFMIGPGFMTGELLPAKIRGRLAGYIYTYFSVVTFVLNKFFPLLNSYIGLTGVLFVFGLASLATTALIYFMMPETKGQSLLEIERHFQTHGWIFKQKSDSNSSSANQ